MNSLLMRVRMPLRRQWIGCSLRRITENDGPVPGLISPVMPTPRATRKTIGALFGRIVTRKYYKLFAWLNNTADSDNPDKAPTMKVFQPGQEEQFARLHAASAASEKKLNEAAATPEFSHAQSQWEQQTISGLTNWEVLEPAALASAGGATLTRTESKAILASGKNPSNDTYTVSAYVGPGKITGFRLEVLETGAEKSLGRHTNGGFVLRSFEVKAKTR